MDLVHDRGSMDLVHESGPWTRSKEGVHGPPVHVLSSPFYIHSMVLDILLHDSENHLSIRKPSLCILAAHESDYLSYSVTRQIIIYDVMEDVYSYVRPLYRTISIKVAL